MPTRHELLALELVVPIHCSTFDLLHGDPEVLASEVRRGRVHIATPGEAFGV